MHRDDNLGRPVVVSVGVSAAIGFAWVIGVDQGLWLLLGMLLGTLAFARRFRGAPPLLVVTASILVMAVLVSGVLGAEGIRWLTFARELLIVIAFLGALFGATVAAQSSGTLIAVVTATVCSFVVLSSIASLVGFVLQEPMRFQTLIAPLVPDYIAQTGLGSASLVERSIAEESFFLGTTFLRPQGLFLFSTSQAVAQALAIPLMLAAGLWYPRLKYAAWCGALITLAGLVATTTRTPIIALIAASVLVWVLRGYERGALVISIPLRGRRFALTVAAAVAAVSAMWASGILSAGVEVLTTRSLGGRSALYERTVDGWLQRPLAGWGTERDWTPTPEPPPSPTPSPSPTPDPTPSPDIPSEPPRPPELPPLGSHSQYLGLLFKQGVIGFAAFVVLVAIVIGWTWKAFRRGVVGAELLMVALVASLLAGVTESLWLDPATATISGTVWGIAIGWRRRDSSQGDV